MTIQFGGRVVVKSQKHFSTLHTQNNELTAIYAKKGWPQVYLTNSGSEFDAQGKSFEANHADAFHTMMAAVAQDVPPAVAVSRQAVVQQMFEHMHIDQLNLLVLTLNTIRDRMSEGLSKIQDQIFRPQQEQD